MENKMNINNLNCRLVLSAQEVADLMKISISHVYESIHRGDLPSIKMGRRIVIPARPIFKMLGIDDSATPSYGVREVL